MKGVDISHYQNGLTIKQIKSAGNDFAIMKVSEGTNYTDPSAFTFYKEAYELGFPVGCYCYSHATNAQQAMAEAAYLLDAINGFPMPCGVFLDIEEPEQLEMTSRELKNIILGWCAAVAGKGYIPGIYGSEGTLWSKVIADELPVGTLVWVARWSSAPPDTPCDLWQNSDNGSIPGYSGPVDTDESRSSYFETIVSSGYPNWKSSAEKEQDASTTPHPASASEQDIARSEKSDPIVLVLQMLMSYAGYWKEVTGLKSPEFFVAARQLLSDLAGGDVDGAV